jgi:hypothetical protein
MYQFTANQIVIKQITKSTYINENIGLLFLGFWCSELSIRYSILSQISCNNYIFYSFVEKGNFLCKKT